MKKAGAICLLSGGLDSAVAAANAVAQGIEIVEAISVIYGQKHARERQSARDVAAYFKVPLHEVEMPYLGGSALTDADKDIPTDGKTQGVAPTFVPARNALLICYAANRAAIHGADYIVTGVNAVDYSGYPDCRPEFISSMTTTMKLALELPAVEVLAPLIFYSKEDIIREGTRVGAPLHITWSCYAGGNKPCGVCDSCRIRAAGFAAAGLEDPAL